MYNYRSDILVYMIENFFNKTLETPCMVTSNRNALYGYK